VRRFVSVGIAIDVGVCCPTSDPDAAAAREARLEALMAQKYM
jgi:hypothetical protein